MTCFRVTTFDDHVYQVWAEDAVHALEEARAEVNRRGLLYVSFASVTVW